jgi:hypothetical protein
MDFPNTFCPDPQGKSIHPGLPQLPEMKKKYKVLLTDGHWAKTLVFRLLLAKAPGLPQPFFRGFVPEGGSIPRLFFTPITFWMP